MSVTFVGISGHVPGIPPVTFAGTSVTFPESPVTLDRNTQASVLQQEVREADMVARMGGEEFAILMPAIDGERAMPVAERIRAAVAERAFRYDGRLNVLTISIGLAQTYADDSEASLIKAADEAMYRAKHDGRNRVRLANRSGQRADATVTPLVPRAAHGVAGHAVTGRVA